MLALFKDSAYIFTDHTNAYQLDATKEKNEYNGSGITGDIDSGDR